MLQCSKTMLLAMTYDLCHGGHMVAEYPLLHTPGRTRGQISLLFTCHLFAGYHITSAVFSIFVFGLKAWPWLGGILYSIGRRKQCPLSLRGIGLL